MGAAVATRYSSDLLNASSAGTSSSSVPRNSTNSVPITPSSTATQTTVELAPGLFVTEREVREMLSAVSSSDGLVTIPKLTEYLHEQGLDASSEDVKEMIRMLPQDWVSSNDSSALHPSPLSSLNSGHRNYGDNDQYSNSFPVSFRSTSTEPPNPSTEASELEDLIWRNFLNQAFIVVDRACKDHILETIAIEQRESYIFLAIPSLTFLELISATPIGQTIQNEKSIKIGQDLNVCIDNCPQSFEWYLPLEQILKARKDLLEFEKNSGDPTLRSMLRLALAADPEEGVSFDDMGDSALNRIRGNLQGAATLLTQTDRFRENFEEILNLVEAVCAAR